MSFNLQESVLLLQDPDEGVPIQHELDVPSMAESEAMDYLERECAFSSNLDCSVRTRWARLGGSDDRQAQGREAR